MAGGGNEAVLVANVFAVGEESSIPINRFATVDIARGDSYLLGNRIGLNAMPGT